MANLGAQLRRKSRKIVVIVWRPAMDAEYPDPAFRIIHGIAQPP